MEDTFKIHLYVADEEFYVRIPKDEETEGQYRDAVRKINRLLSSYRGAYNAENGSLGTKRLLAMTALHLAKEAIAAERDTDSDKCLSMIEDLDKDLEVFLND